MSGVVKVTFVLLLGVCVVQASFSTGFHNFLAILYGADVADQLERKDLGNDAAFGGGNSSFTMHLSHDPIVLVHANRRYASDEVNNSKFFESNGFEKGSVFATSWGPNGHNMNFNETLHCSYVKQIRRLIIAVHLYTLRDVIVGAQSLGSAITRKALLGGKCVDTGEDLGLPLSSIVSVFFSLAGVNQALGRCLDTPYKTQPLCTDNVAGVAPNTSSLYLKDINSRQHYEAQKVYVVASQTDDAVTYPYISLPAADINVTLSGFSHTDTQFNTLDIQLEMINNRHLSDETLQKDVDLQSERTGKKCTGSVDQ